MNAIRQSAMSFLSSIQFESPMTLGLVALGLLVAALSWVIFRAVVGPPATISRRVGLYVLRGVLLATLLAVLLNPVRVTQSPGIVERPEMFYLLDSSQSMALGDPMTRWDEATKTIHDAAEATRGGHVDVKLFRFGQRLLASDDFEKVGLQRRRHAPRDEPGRDQRSTADHGLRGEGVERRSAHHAERDGYVGQLIAAETAKADTVSKKTTKAPLAPTDSDTQLVTALRQISSRFGHKPPSGIVLFSDGRARDETGVEQIASQFQRLKVPVHVVPTGSLGKRGDISIVAAVVPPRVRKFTEVEVQVFIRSFGFDGHRTELQLSVPDAPGKPGRKLSSVPVTLHSGFQAATLSFRSTLESHKVRVSIPIIDDEISDTNNSLTSEIAIDRTKIRVLYVEGSSQSMSIASSNTGRNMVRGPFSDLSRAIMEDDDIECVTLATIGGFRLGRVAEYGFDTAHGFPETKAELAAFDAIVLSDVPERVFTEKQLEWIDEWVGQRGGGLMMAGGPRSFGAGGWADSRLAEMLPVEMLPGGDWNSSEQLRWRPLVSSELHPVWTLFADQAHNTEVLQALPGFNGANRFAAVKPNLTLTLADSTITQPGSRPVPQQAPSNGAVQDFFKRLIGTEDPNALQALPNAPERASDDAGTSAAVVVGRYGRGRTMAISTAITAPWAKEFLTQWKSGDQNNHSKFWRNVVYWLTENSSIGRRRLIATADKRFYHPGDVITIGSSAFNELAKQTKDYRIVAMIEPNTTLKDNPGDDSPLRWPEGVTRTSSEDGPYIAWGEELEIPLVAEGDKPSYGLTLPIADALATGSANHSLRLELTAYEDLTQVDSTSLDIQILHDPFELQNPFPNHDLLKRIATLSGGKVLSGSADLAQVLNDIPVKVGPPITSKAPIWSTWPLWTWIIGLLTVEWLWRRKIGLA